MHSFPPRKTTYIPAPHDMELSLIFLLLPPRIRKVNRGGTQQFVPLARFVPLSGEGRGGVRPRPHPSVPHRERERERERERGRMRCKSQQETLHHFRTHAGKQARTHARTRTDARDPPARRVLVTFSYGKPSEEFSTSRRREGRVDTGDVVANFERISLSETVSPNAIYRCTCTNRFVHIKNKYSSHKHCMLRKRTQETHVGLPFPKSLELAARRSGGHHLYLRPI